MLNCQQRMKILFQGGKRQILDVQALQFLLKRSSHSLRLSKEAFLRYYLVLLSN